MPKYQYISSPKHCVFCNKDFDTPLFFKREDDKTAPYETFCPHCGLEVLEAVTWDEEKSLQELKRELNEKIKA